MMEIDESAMEFDETAFDMRDADTFVFPAIKLTLKRDGSINGAPTDRESYLANLKKVLKSSGIYALASLASPLVQLALLPFLTHYLSRSDYAALAVLNTAIALVACVTQ